MVFYLPEHSPASKTQGQLQIQLRALDSGWPLSLRLQPCISYSSRKQLPAVCSPPCRSGLSFSEEFCCWQRRTLGFPWGSNPGLCAC